MSSVEEALLLKPPPSTVVCHRAAAEAVAAACHHDGCPGCAMDRRKESLGGRIPIRELSFVSATTLAASLPITCLFPFMYFMVRDFNVAKNEEDIGSYAGFLAASYMIGRATTSIFWGIAADRLGRKPVIAFSMLSVVLLQTLFGLSTKYWMAVAARLLLGSLNGILGPIKAYAIEVCQTEHQALGLSVVNTAWGVGLVIGPGLGGYLAQPAEKYQRAFSKESIFGRFPYLLPCLVVSLFAAIVLLSCIWLPETIHKHKITEKDIKIVKALPSQQAHWDLPRKKSLLQNWPWMSTMASYCLFGLHETAYSEILSLWAVSDRKYGGLSFSSGDIGEVLAVAGASLLVYQLIIYHWVNKFLGPLISSRIASALSILVLATFPFMTYLSGSKLSFALYAATMTRSVLGITISTAMCLIQNNAVRQDQRGTANGISTTAMSFFKAVAPLGAGVLFSWAQKRQNATFFPGFGGIFVGLGVSLSAWRFPWREN
ncbi:protein ZINC INDUCED FACILITATOR-LIKE 1 isoform X3 [Brachypodium distachyon]|uniref:protein ZINC INDUCED FACILITATOR-LIKE 1 isoform X3 n=1 Tax=Brachypodium distachyon TaxID=15368 RepID=UPI000D0DE2C3|nr:protein ZINC INDUCED FACILITATOR-LIKE 1 isoform X3 [Brachypodium distachyon]|eukprot:XP_024318601.1 protein ZINC INDUCED FACILITATOR-LIKE 1 isoform X3 [Brachypodium distachyon]